MISYIMHQESPGIAWNGPELSGIARNCPEFPGIAQNRQEMSGIARIRPDLPRFAGNCQELHGAGFKWFTTSGRNC